MLGVCIANPQCVGPDGFGRSPAGFCVPGRAAGRCQVSQVTMQAVTIISGTLRRDKDIRAVEGRRALLGWMCVIEIVGADIGTILVLVICAAAVLTIGPGVGIIIG